MIGLGCLGSFLLGACSQAWAADSPAPPEKAIPENIQKPKSEEARPYRPRTREDFERLREEWDRLSPEEKEARKKALFQKTGKPMFSRKEFEKRCQEMEDLSPEARRARIREWRERELALRERFQRSLAALRIKQKEGTLDEEEAKRLERMEVLAARFEKTRKPPNNPRSGRSSREYRDFKRSKESPVSD